MRPRASICPANPNLKTSALLPLSHTDIILSNLYTLSLFTGGQGVMAVNEVRFVYVAIIPWQPVNH